MDERLPVAAAIVKSTVGEGIESPPAPAPSGTGSTPRRCCLGESDRGGLGAWGLELGERGDRVRTVNVERVISSDDHADLSHEQVKRFLVSSLHDEYDRAVEKYLGSLRITGAANARWREQQGES